MSPFKYTKLSSFYIYTIFRKFDLLKENPGEVEQLKN